MSKKWKEAFFVLYGDSALEWYQKPTDKKPLGTIMLRDVLQYIFIGEYTRTVPNRPTLPAKSVESLLGINCVLLNYDSNF